ncbi:hypothetical protein VTJ04DRAFT_9153 [Mycothermus thermophilus]|uniref:uncharacterized protein n=1 Tax=Humicola insolens TaxID=85995 RepID=UPI003742CCBE
MAIPSLPPSVFLLHASTSGLGNDSIPAEEKPKTFHFARYQEFRRDMIGHWTFEAYTSLYWCEEPNGTAPSSVVELLADHPIQPIEFTIVDPCSSDSTTARDPRDYTATQAETCADWPGVAWTITGVLPKYEDGDLLRICPFMPKPREDRVQRGKAPECGQGVFHFL